MTKRLVAFVLVVIISLCCALSCTAVEIDGAAGNAEWSGAQSYSFESPDGFNNNVKFALMRLIPNTEANRLFLCVTMTLSEFADASKTGIILSLNGGEAIRLGGDGTADYNVDIYNAEYEMVYDELTKTVIYEILFGVKFGIPEKSQLSVQLSDCDGAPSNVFGFDLDLINENAVESETEKAEVKTSKKTNKTKPSKTASPKEDDFTFKKAETDKSVESVEQDEATTETVNLTNKAVNNSSVKMKVLTATGVICALAVATCAVYGGIKKSQEKADKK